MRFWISIFLLTLTIALKAQVTVDRAHHHFGKITKETERFHDFVLTNKGSEKVFILRVDSDRDVKYLASKRTLLKDSVATIRIQFNPTEKGRFSRQISVYVSNSNEPLTLSISGEVDEVPSVSDMPCPDFSRIADPAAALEFLFKVDVIDAFTGEPIPLAKVKVIDRGLLRYDWKTDGQGHYERKIPLGYYYFVGSAKGYQNQELASDVNIRNDRLVLELTPVITRPIDPMPDDTVFFADRPGEEWITEEDEVKTGDDPKDQTAGIDEPLEVTEEKTEEKVQTPVVLEETYLNNNLVFLIDVSGSMVNDGKMELLKASMIELTQTLRPEDQISIVVYSDRARVVLEPISGNRKDEVIKTIMGLEGEGYTAGEEGMKMAYSLAQKNFMEKGNNMVIMATDGAFNLYTTNVIPLTRRYFKRGIYTSVVGIKCLERDTSSMSQIATTGGGRFVYIGNLEQSRTGLTDEVRTASRRH